MTKIIDFFLERISVKLDAHKLKPLVDIIFIFSEKIIVKLEKLLSFYLDFYETMIENEIKLANICKNDKILHIGCGAIPATSILLVKKTNADIVAIDKDLKSVEQAKMLLSKIGLSDKIRIIYADASNFPIKIFDLIIVSQGIKPHDIVLKKIAKNIDNKNRVIFRTSSTYDKKLSPKDLFLENIFIINDVVSQEKNGLMISVLLSKKI